VLRARDDSKALGYHQDLALLTLPGGKAAVAEGMLVDADAARLDDLFPSGHALVPRCEWTAFAMNSILIDERQGHASRLAIIPPNCPVLSSFLLENGYEVVVQPLSYSHGGGFLRCLTLFGDARLESDEALRQHEGGLAGGSGSNADGKGLKRKAGEAEESTTATDAADAADASAASASCVRSAARLDVGSAAVDAYTRDVSKLEMALSAEERALLRWDEGTHQTTVAAWRAYAAQPFGAQPKCAMLYES